MGDEELQSPPRVTEEEKVLLGRWVLVALLVVALVWEIKTWAIRHVETGFDEIAFLADASTLLVNITLLWWLLLALLLGFRRLLAMAVEVVIRVVAVVWRHADGVTVFEPTSRKVTTREAIASLGGALAWHAKRMFRRQVPANTGEGQRAVRPRQIGPRSLAAVLFLASFALGVVLDRMNERTHSFENPRPVIALPATKLAAPAAAKMAVPKNCSRETSSITCRLQKGENPTSLAQRISNWQGCPSAIWDQYLRDHPGARDRRIPTDSKLEIPSACMGEHMIVEQSG